MTDLDERDLYEVADDAEQVLEPVREWLDAERPVDLGGDEYDYEGSS